jgi:UDP-3-O-[3-hydroxymyristoyl] glucosamine N-acyltransferase
MVDPRFYRTAGPFTVAALARIAGAEVGGAGDVDQEIHDVAALATAGSGEISFLDNSAYLEIFRGTKASACLVVPDMVAEAPAGITLLITDTPYTAYAHVARAFHPDAVGDGGVSPGAQVDPTARIAPDVTIGYGAVIAARAEIGARSEIGAYALIGEGVKIGEECSVGSHVSIRYCIAGDRLRIYAGARIGEDGFGYASDGTGHTKIPQLGRVIIGNDVEIGANSAIDRGSGPDTVINDSCIIDNLVQIGHNVRLGKGCILVSQVGISGSTTICDNVVIGGQGGVAGHLTIGAGARVAAQSGVMSDIAPGAVVMGYPAQNRRAYLREVATLRKLARKKSE